MGVCVVLCVLCCFVVVFVSLCDVVLFCVVVVVCCCVEEEEECEREGVTIELIAYELHPRRSDN